jgi:hypothetical protein
MYFRYLLLHVQVLQESKEELSSVHRSQKGCKLVCITRTSIVRTWIQHVDAGVEA